ncbi:hypothetical protein D5086_008992 [Populus alba]|uniref:Uncharacterized protein n=1 Tax=Populus alba TaxID=43335 RepID=A0ACC4CHN0_POPAL
MDTLQEDEEYSWREVTLPSLIPVIPEPGLERETGERRRGRDILIAIDHGPNSKHAFDWALIHLCRLADTLHLVHAVSSVQNTVVYETSQQLMEKLAVEALQVAMVRTVARIVQGDAGKAICNEAERLKPAAVVMSTRGRSLVQSVLQGSVSEYCFHHCKAAPVIVVPGKEKHTLKALETLEEDEEYNWKEVTLPSFIPVVPKPELDRETGERRRGRDNVVAIDHRPNSKHAFDWALIHLCRLADNIHLVHAVLDMQLILLHGNNCALQGSQPEALDNPGTRGAVKVSPNENLLGYFTNLVAKRYLVIKMVLVFYLKQQQTTDSFEENRMLKFLPGPFLCSLKRVVNGLLYLHSILVIFSGIVYTGIGYVELLEQPLVVMHGLSKVLEPLQLW